MMTSLSLGCSARHPLTQKRAGTTTESLTTSHLFTQGLKPPACNNASGRQANLSKQDNIMLDLIKSIEGSSIVTKTNAKTGSITTRLQTAKEYKDDYKAKNPNSTAAQRKAAFEAYTREESVKLAEALDHAQLIRLLAEKKLGVKRHTLGKGTLTTVYVDISNMTNEARAKEQIDLVDASKMQDLLVYIQSKLAK